MTEQDIEALRLLLERIAAKDYTLEYWSITDKQAAWLLSSAFRLSEVERERDFARAEGDAALDILRGEKVNESAPLVVGSELIQAAFCVMRAISAIERETIERCAAEMCLWCKGGYPIYKETLTWGRLWHDMGTPWPGLDYGRLDTESRSCGASPIRSLPLTTGEVE